jgi:hypothetical protein
MAMRWMIGLAAALAISGSAHATVFFASAVATYDIPEGRWPDVSVGASFPEVDLHPGDTLDLEITFDQAFIQAIAGIPYVGFAAFNLPYGPLPGGLDHIHYCNYPCFGLNGNKQDVSAYVEGTVQTEFAKLDSYSEYLVPAPEPIAWVLLLAGVALTGTSLRRRRVGALASADP